MKFRTQTILFLILVPSALIFFLLYLSTYVVRETDQVIITRFGQVRGDPVKDPGLHWKMPFIDRRQPDRKTLSTLGRSCQRDVD